MELINHRLRLSWVRNRCIPIIAVVLLLLIVPASWNQSKRIIYQNEMKIADDGAPPEILLLSPANGSVVKPLSLIDIDVTDNVGISHVFYHWDLIANETFESPYDLLARTSEVGHYLYIYANDTSGTWTTAMFYFISDWTSPEITLTTPTNNSVQLSGTEINATVTDIHLTDVYYQWDDLEILNIWTEPYTIQLIVSDGPHTLHVYANDSAGNWGETKFVFIVDDEVPIITLRDLTNGSARQSNSLVDIDIIDASIAIVLYNWNSGLQNITWEEPFLTPIPAGESIHTLRVYANDSFSRWSSVIFEFTGDNTIPEILLDSPLNGSLHNSGINISLFVTDLHLSSIRYNWDGLGNQTVSGSISLPSGDGDHILKIYAEDTAENMAHLTYLFRVDDSPPVITLFPESLILQGFINFTIEWRAFDANPDSYTILINGSEIISGSWIDRIRLTISHEFGLKIWYNCTIILTDLVGNLIINSTMILIEIWPADEFGSLIPLFVIGGIVSATGVLVLVIMKKNGVRFTG